MTYPNGPHIRRVIILVGILAVLSIPPFSFAAVLYSRSPAGTEAIPPLIVSVSADNFTDFNFSGGTASYTIAVSSDKVDFWGDCHTTSALSIAEEFTIPIGFPVIVISAEGFDSQEHCASAASTYPLGSTGFLFLEGNAENIIFRIVTPPLFTGSSAPPAHRPEVNIEFPREGDFIGATTTIRYAASDEDTIKYPPFGFGEKPISVYYSDVRDPVEKGWFRVAEDIANTGEHVWNVADFPDGEYFLKIIGRDQAGDRDEEVAGPFFLDTIPPVFDIAVEPPVSKGEKVKIIAEASEPLGAAPVVVVRQRGFTDIEVPMRGEGARWEGVYEVRQNFDGTARVGVFGKDRAGNESRTIRRGGTFAVGANPPPQPVITSPLDNDITATSTIVVRGSMREDAKGLVFVNDEKAREIVPDADGGFSAEIILSALRAYGKNIIRVVSEDAAGNLSEPAVITVSFNLAPELSVLAPAADAVVRRTSAIRIAASDRNKDRLSFSYALSGDDGATWALLAERVAAREYRFDSAQFSDGAYRARVTAHDGAAETVAVSEKFFIRNFLPAISFDGGARSVIAERAVVVTGSAASHEKAEEQSAIAAVEYRVGEEKEWRLADASDGAFGGIVERFGIPLSGLGEGIYSVFVRARDSRGLFGRAAKIVVIDFGPPPIPVVTAPANNAVLGNGDDADANQAGIQFSVSGTAEPGSKVRVSVGGKTFSGIAAENGAFRVDGVTMRERGANVVSVFAEDTAGNKSPAASVLYMYNNPPRIMFLAPRSGDGLNHKAALEWDIRDPDGDAVKNAVLSYRKGGGTFVVLARNPAGQKFVWDVGGLAQGDDYQLKLEADDGLSRAEEIIGIIIDNAAPTIAAAPFPETPFAKKFILRAEGTAADNFSGVQFVEYAVGPRGGHEADRRWYKAVITRGFRERNASFRFAHPFALEDGAYEVGIRSVDAAGNVSGTFSRVITVDTTPPRVGSYMLTAGALALFPDGGRFLILRGEPVRFLLSLERDAKEAALSAAGGTVPLARNNATGLWEGEIFANEATTTELLLSGRDALGNGFTGRGIGTVAIVRSGRVSEIQKDGGEAVAGARVGVLVFDAEEKKFRRWQAESYGGENPVMTRDDGTYRLLLPAGRYSLTAEKRGFARARSEVFEIAHPRFVTVDFALPRRAGLRGALEDFIGLFGD